VKKQLITSMQWKLEDKAEIMKKVNFAQIMLIFGIVTVILIIVLGIYILITPTLSYLSKYLRTIFAVVVIGYGSYRLMNMFHLYKNKEEK